MRLLILASALVVAAAAPALAATNLVTNGDFSSPNTGGGYGVFSLAQSGWSNLTDSGVEIGDSGLYGVPCISTGCQNLEVNANTFGDVVQTIGGLTAGSKYVLQYEYGGRPGGGTQILNVNFAGGHVSTDTGSDGEFTAYKYVVTAAGPSAVLEFKSQVTAGRPSYGNEITGVSLTAVPEPATWALMVVGFGMISVARRRRRAIAV